MADKPKPKAASGKAKAAKPAAAKSAKSAEATPAAPKAAAPKTATAKTAKPAAKTGKKGKPKAGKVAAGSPKPSKAETPAVEKHIEPDVETFYVCSGTLPFEIHRLPPVSGAPFVEFSSFATAHEHLLDQLIEVIEEYERVLHAVRGATSFADYRDRQG